MNADLVKQRIQNIENKLIQSDGSISQQTVLEQLHELAENLEGFCNPASTCSNEQKYELSLALKRLQMNLNRSSMIQNRSILLTSASTSIIDIFLHQILIEMDINEFVNQYYFDVSLCWLTDDNTIDYIDDKQSPNPIDDRLLDMFSKIGNHAMVNKIRKNYGMSVMRKNTPSFFKKDHRTNRLLVSFMNRLDRHFHENPMTKTQGLIFFWVQGMLDIITFVPYFIDLGYAELAVKWLSIESSETEISLRAWRETLDLVHNLARHEEGLKALNNLNTMGILKNWKKNYLSVSINSKQENYKDLIMLYYMNYALLLEPSVLKKEDPADIHIAIDCILELAILAFESPAFRCGPYHVSEFWDPLAKLSVNDKYLQYILEHEGTFEFMLAKFIDFNRLIKCLNNEESSDLNILICSLFYSLFWSISFQATYHCKLKSNKEILEHLRQNAIIDSNDELIKSIRQSANGILFNLDLFQETFSDKQAEERYRSDEVRVMISYSHKDTSFCRSIVNYLEKYVQGDIWVDFMKLQPPYEDDWEEIAAAITNCDVIVMIVTENYCSSKSCRREVIHADKRKKRMIPVYQGHQYEPDDWFEIRAGSATWVRFHTEKSNDDALNTLLKLVVSQEKLNRSLESATMKKTNSGISKCDIPIVENPSQVNKSTVTLAVDRWTENEIRSWLPKSLNFMEFSNGHALLAYARLLSDQQIQIDEYEKCICHRGVTRQEWANFVSAILHLKNTEHIKHDSNIPIGQWSFEEVKAWFDDNQIPDYFSNTLTLRNGNELMTYGHLLLATHNRIDSEYNRLRSSLKISYQDQELPLDVYTRFVTALDKIIKKSTDSSVSKQNDESFSHTNNNTSFNRLFIQIILLLLLLINLMVLLKIYS